MRTVRDRSAVRSARPPAVSVCIPAYNSAAYIGEAVQSVLDQDFADVELIVVDDQSSDGTVDAVIGHDDGRLRIFQNTENLGAPANWDRAAGLARGRYVKLLCGDDLLRPGCLETQVRALDAEPGAVLAAGRRDIIDAGGRIVMAGRGLGTLRGVVDGREAVRATVRAGTNLFGEPGCVLLRRELLDRCGGFSPARRYMVDIDYWCRMLRFGPLFAQDETVAAFRISAGSWSVALVRNQAAEAVQFFRDLHREDPSRINRHDLAAGTAKARALAAGRAASYRALAASRRFGPVVARTARSAPPV